MTELQPGLPQQQMIDDETRKQLNLEIWNSLSITDPAFTREIEGKDYKGTTVKPHYVVWRLTEKFGPVGVGWGWEIVDERIDAFGEHERMHVVRMRFWYRPIIAGIQVEERATIEQFGQTRYAYMTKGNYLKVDEDAPKKSITDALTKCASYVGAAGDIFLGQWCESYVGRARNYIARTGQGPKQPLAQADGNNPVSGKPQNVATPETKKTTTAEQTKAQTQIPPSPKTLEDLADLALKIEKCVSEKEITGYGLNVYTWYVQRNKVALAPMLQDKEFAKLKELAGKIVQRRSDLVIPKTMPSLKQMSEALVSCGLLTKSQADVPYNLARTRLNYVEPSQQ